MFPGDDGAASLADALKINKSLRVLSLRENSILEVCRLSLGAVSLFCSATTHIHR